MKKRALSGLLASLMLLCLLSACGSGASVDAGSSGDTSGTPSYTWKMALNSTAGDNAYDAGAFFADYINQQTNGQVKVDLYGGASLGSTSEVLEGMSSGVADILCESVGTLAPFTELANIDAVPYIFSGYDHFMKVWTSDFGQTMKDTIGDAAGFKLLGAAYRGPRIVTATKKMEAVDDFKGFKLRAPNLDVYIKTWKWMKAAPTPMPLNDVYTALQQGTVEGQENPMADDLNYSFDDVCHYWIKTNHVYSCNLFIMDKNYFDSLPDEIQSAVEEAADYAGKKISEIQLERDTSSEETLKKEGCEIIDVDTEAFADYFNGFAEQNYPDLLDWVNQIKAMDPSK